MTTAPAQVVFHREWRSTHYAAKFYDRSLRRIQKWCNNGTFASAGIPVFQDAKKRWWINIVEEKENKTD